MSILITGTSRGIGKELALRFIVEGYKVIGCSRTESTIKEDNYYKHYILDVSNAVDVANLFYSLEEVPTVIINNAGISSMNHCLTTPPSTFKKILEVNLAGTFFVSTAGAKKIVANKLNGGRIINISSVAVSLNLEGESAYVASKAGVEALTKVMAKELAPFDITVNAIEIPPTDTDLISGVSDEKIDNILSQQAIFRKCTFDDIFNAVTFLIWGNSEFITGQVLKLGGVI